jgi:hypothetical protein
MKNARGAGLALVLLSGFLCNAAEVPLPDENGSKPALGCEPFPSRLHQFVWRNWTVVPQARLAEVLKTSPESVAQVAASMGLPPQGGIQSEWQERGYITVLRRNWHLLPYGQLTELLGFTRERLRYSLMEATSCSSSSAASSRSASLCCTRRRRRRRPRPPRSWRAGCARRGSRARARAQRSRASRS